MQTQTDTVARRAEDFATGVKEQAQKIKKDYIDGALEQAGGYVKENPAKTLLLAVGVGVVLGSMLRRR